FNAAIKHFRSNSLSSTTSRTSDSANATSSVNANVTTNSQSVSLPDDYSQNTQDFNSQNVLTKIKTIQRVLGSSATTDLCKWSLEATSGDSAHAVKLIRLKALLPESLLMDRTEHVVSVLEMSHWDVARAAAFLLNNTKSTHVTKLKMLAVSNDESNPVVVADNIGSGSSSISSNNNNIPPEPSPRSSNRDVTGSALHNSKENRFIRPTHV
ncbi:hypothetical protein Ocin01_01171, partial [Orchesella cincta]